MAPARPTRYYLNRWWSVYRRIYAPLNINELIESALGHARDKVHVEREPYVGLIFMDMIYLYAFGNNSLNRCFNMLRECPSNFSYVIQKIVTGTMQHEPLPNQASLISMTHTTHICPDHDTLKSPVHLAPLLLSQQQWTINIGRAVRLETYEPEVGWDRCLIRPLERGTRSLWIWSLGLQHHRYKISTGIL